MSDRALWQLVDVEFHRDERGALVPFEAGGNLSFEPRRTFFLFDVPPEATRGGHATTCRELLIALRGSCSVELGEGAAMTCLELRSPTRALDVLAGERILLRSFSPDALIAVLADAPYRPR